MTELGLAPSTYEGPTGIVGVLADTLARGGVEVLSLWAAIPHYVSPPPCPKATLALLSQLEQVLDSSLELGELPELARAWERGVDELAAEDTEVAEYVDLAGAAAGRRPSCPRPAATRSPPSSSVTCGAVRATERRRVTRAGPRPAPRSCPHPSRRFHAPAQVRCPGAPPHHPKPDRGVGTAPGPPCSGSSCWPAWSSSASGCADAQIVAPVFLVLTLVITVAPLRSSWSSTGGRPGLASVVACWPSTRCCSSSWARSSSRRPAGRRAARVRHGVQQDLRLAAGVATRLGYGSEQIQNLASSFQLSSLTGPAQTLLGALTGGASLLILIIAVVIFLAFDAGGMPTGSRSSARPGRTSPTAWSTSPAGSASTGSSPRSSA